MTYMPYPGFGPYRVLRAGAHGAGGEKLELAGMEIDVIFTPGHSPGHVTYAIARREGDLLRRRAVPGLDRAHRPARRRRPQLLRSIAGLIDRFPTRRGCYPGHMGVTTLGARARHQSLPRRARPRLARMSGQIQAPRGTFDVLPEDGARRAPRSRRPRGRSSSRAGYGRIETPDLRGTELFARGVGESTDIVQKEMYTFEDGGGRSLTLRPEGTAPICRAYVEHGMHKLPQPVKLWYRRASSATSARRPGATASSGRSARRRSAPTTPPSTPSSIAAAARRCWTRSGSRGVRLRLASLGTPETRAAYREELQGTCARTRTGSPTRSAAASTQPAARVRRRPRGHARGDGGAPRLLDRLAADDAEHFAEVRALLDAAGRAYEIDPTLVRGLDYYTRTVFEFTSDALGAQRGVGGGGRYDGLVEQLGGPPTPGVRLGGRASSACCWPRRGADGAAAASTSTSRCEPGRARGVPRSSPRRARAGCAAQMEPAGRSLKGQLKQADRLGRALRCRRRRRRARQLRDMEAGDEEELSAAPTASSRTSLREGPGR